MTASEDPGSGARPDGGSDEERPVTDIAGIGESYGGRLGEAGIGTVEGLLAADAATVSEETGIGEARIGKWQDTAAEAYPELVPDGDTGAGAAEEESAEEESAEEDEQPEEESVEEDHVEEESAEEDHVEEESAEEDSIDEDGPAEVPEEVDEAAGSAGVSGDDSSPGGDGSEPDVTSVGEISGGDESDASGAEAETTASGKSEAELEREILDPEERVGPGQKLCLDCDAIIDESAEVCPECGTRQQPQEEPEPDAAEDEIDLVLVGAASVLVPGVGHLLAGKTTRGGVWLAVFLVALVVDFFVFLVSLFLTFFGIGILGFVLIFLFHLVFHLAATFDAVNQAKKINEGEISVD